MTGSSHILVDLERCVGCYACEVACKQEHPDTEGVPWIRVHIVGPEVADGKLRMDFIPHISGGCDFCRSRDMQPTCAAHCPTRALSVSPASSVPDILKNNPGYRLCSADGTD